MAFLHVKERRLQITQSLSHSQQSKLPVEKGKFFFPRIYNETQENLIVLALCQGTHGLGLTHAYPSCRPRLSGSQASKELSEFEEEHFPNVGCQGEPSVGQPERDTRAAKVFHI